MAKCIIGLNRRRIQTCFLKRKQAVELYFKNEKSLNEIMTITGIRRDYVYKFAKRCLEIDENEELWGFRALIPYKRTNGYSRKSLPQNNSTNLAGAFTLLLDSYPSIQETIHDYILKITERILVLILKRFTKDFLKLAVKQVSQHQIILLIRKQKPKEPFNDIQ